ncbi:MAG: hypothetical protein KTV45_10735 [Acidimicrobiia bacterium]|nr:hypothetical protein [Acidimicrobiia bacterium]
MSEQQQEQQQQQEMRVVFNPSLAAGLMALSEKWGISPLAVARRIVREALRENGVLDRPPRSSQNQDSEPGMVHRTFRVTAMQASFVESAAYRYRLSRSEVIRGVLTYATRQPITYDHLRRAPAEKRTVRWSVRIAPCHDAHITRVARLLNCSETDAGAALLTSMAARRRFLQHLKGQTLNTG